MKLRTNDTVIVIKGRDRGKQGRITRVLPKQQKAVIEGINVMTKHQKPAGAFQQGGIIQKEMPLPVANLAFFHETCDGRGKIGHRMLGDGIKARVCKNCNEVIE